MLIDTIRNEQDSHLIAWAAGLFEGEGCISAYKNSYPIISIASTDRDVIEHFHTVLGGVGRVSGPYYPKRGGRVYKGLWSWYCPRGYAKHVIDLFWPYLGERRKARWLELVEKHTPRKVRVVKVKEKQKYDNIELIKRLPPVARGLRTDTAFVLKRFESRR